MADEKAKAAFADKLKEHRESTTCDFEIVCSGAVFPVHRVIISMHSSYFKRICESKFKERIDRKIVVYEDSTPAIRAMVQYFYEWNYDNPMNTSNGYCPNPQNAIEAHAQIFTLADKYDIPALKDLAFKKLCSYLDGSSTRGLAAELLVATPYVWRNAPPNDKRCRGAVLDAWIMARVSGWKEDTPLSFTRKNALLDLVAELPEFATDWLESVSSARGVVIGGLL